MDLDGIKIGNNVTIGAGAVVTKDTPPKTLSAGVPAKVLKDLSAELNK
jgi:maltose O-acetyltransferase